MNLATKLREKKIISGLVEGTRYTATSVRLSRLKKLNRFDISILVIGGQQAYSYVITELERLCRNGLVDEKEVTILKHLPIRHETINFINRVMTDPGYRNSAITGRSLNKLKLYVILNERRKNLKEILIVSQNVEHSAVTVPVATVIKEKGNWTLKVFFVEG